MKLYKIFVIAVLFPSCFACAQVTDSLIHYHDSITKKPPLVQPYSEPFQDKILIIGKILLIGNKITKPEIVMRELTFAEGDTLSYQTLQQAMQRSRENLLNTSLFNFVSVYDQPDSVNSSFVRITVRMTERWYTWPLPIFELVDRNFNEWWLTKDFTRTNYGIYLTRENFLGLQQSIKLLVRLGYAQRLGLYYSIPYLDKKQQYGISFSAAYTRNHEIPYKNEYDKTVFYKNENEYVRKQLSTGITLTHRKGIHDYYSFTSEFQSITIDDTITALNREYFKNAGARQKLVMLSLQYTRDYRDIKAYTLKGNYFEINLVKQGLGIFNNEPDLAYVIGNYRHYFPLLPRWYYSAGVKGKISAKSFYPYYNSRGLGYGNDFIRGYEYYVMNGQNYYLFKSNLKFALIPERTVKIKQIPLEKFNTIPYAVYLNVFYDMGYVRDRQFFINNSLVNSFQNGTGLGLDYVTYYDLVLRIEYSFNRLGEHGLFLHFTSPIW